MCLSWAYVVTRGWKHQLLRRLTLFLYIYGISMNQKATWHNLHQLPRHFGYQITLHLVNLPSGCHQKNYGRLPSPNNMQPGCQKSPWNCVFQISNGHTMLLSGRYEDIVLHCLSKWTPLYITLNYFGCLWQYSSERELEMNCVRPVLKQ